LESLPSAVCRWRRDGEEERIVVQLREGEGFYQMGTPIKEGKFWKMEN
jgi:hypothetical protein